MRQFIFPKGWLLAVATVFIVGLLSVRTQAGEPVVAPELQVADQFLLAIPKSGFGKD